MVHAHQAGNMRAFVRIEICGRHWLPGSAWQGWALCLMTARLHQMRISRRSSGVMFRWVFMGWLLRQSEPFNSPRMKNRQIGYTCAHFAPSSWPTSSDMSYYPNTCFLHHDRGADSERPSCNRCGSAAMREYAKQRIRNWAQTAPDASGSILRAASTGARKAGVRVYPEGVWYTYVDQLDIDEIIESPPARR
jgi:hypothetical protein